MKQFVWIGPTGGDWATAANWNDLSDGVDPSAIVPGSQDAVRIAGGTDSFLAIAGNGRAGTLALSGDVAIGGSVTVQGAVTTQADAGTIEVTAGGTLSLATIAVLDMVAATGAGASFNAGSLTLGGTSVAGALTVTGGAVMRFGAVAFGDAGGSIHVDAGSVIDIGGTAGATSALTVETGATLDATGTSVIENAVVDNGLIRARGLLSTGMLSGTGTLEVVTGGSLDISNLSATGGLTLQVDSGASLSLGTSAGGAGDVIVLTGSNDVLTLGAAGLPYYGNVGVTIAGFDQSDTLVVSAGGVTRAVYVAGSDAAHGTLELLSGIYAVASVALIGEYAGRRFIVTADNSNFTAADITLAPLVIIPPGTTTADRFTWVGPASGGVWSNVANWDDVTAGADPALVAPGSLDSVAFSGPLTAIQTIGGDGHAAAMTVTGDNAFTGNILISGSLDATASGTAEVTVGATLSVATASLGGSLVADGVSADASQFASSFIAASMNMLGAAARLAVTDGALAQIGSLTVNGGANGTLSVDNSSTADIGLLTVTAGATLEIDGSPYGYAAVYGAATIHGAVTDDGLVRASFFQLNGDLSGSGTLDVLASKSAVVDGAITAGSLTLQIERNAQLTLNGAVGAGDSIVFAGDGLLRLGIGSTIESVGTLVGFDGTDVLHISGPVVTDASYAAGAEGAAGTLTLLDGTTVVSTVMLAGDFTGRRFVTGSLDYGETQIIVAPIDSGGVGPGTTTGDSFTWTGNGAVSGSGAWGDARNWQDVTSGDTPALIAPGSLDHVTLGGGGGAFGSVFELIAGSGQAASATINGALDITGTFTVAGAVTANVGAGYSSTVLIQGGGSLTAGTFTNGADLAVSGIGSRLVANTLSIVGAIPPRSSGLGDLTATGGAVVLLGTLTTAVIAEIQADSTAIIDIGGTTGAVGALTVEQGATATLSGFARLGGTVVDNGVIQAATLSMDSPSGTGTIEITGGGRLTVDTIAAGSLTVRLDQDASLSVTGSEADTVRIGAGITVALVGSNHVIGVRADDQGTIHEAETITGFGTLDALVLNFATVTGAVWQAGTAGQPGTLSLMNGSASIGTVALTGDYTGQTFVTTQFVDSVAVVTLPSSAAIGNLTANGGSFRWTGASSALWNDAANWNGPITVAPGSHDGVSFYSSTSAFQHIGGIGNAGSLTLIGDNAVDGTVEVYGTLGLFAVYGNGNFDTSKTLEVNAGATLSAEAAVAVGSLVVQGAGAVFAAGTMTIGSASLPGDPIATTIAATGGGAVRIGGFNNVFATAITVDAASVIAIGGTGGTAGALTVATGAVVTSTAALTIAGSVVDDGVVYAGALTLGGSSATLSGSGAIEVTQGGSVDVTAAVAAAGLLFRIDSDATLAFRASVGAGNRIAMTGTNEVLRLDNRTGGAIANGAVIGGFAASDTLDILNMGVTGARYAENADHNAGTLDLLAGTTIVESLTLAGNYAGDAFTVTVIDATHAQVATVGPIACFAAGTRLATPDGPRMVETLRAGDTVLTASGAAAAVVWLGHRTIACGRHPRPHDVLPVRVRAHAFAAGQPARDVVLSPDHAVFVDGRLIPVRYLLNGASVVQEQTERVAYWHVELAAHDLLLAEGLACESYLDTGNRCAFANGGASIQAHPDFARGVWAARSCAPLVTAGPAVMAARTALAARLPALGFAVTADPDLRVLADGMAVAAQVYGDWLCFALPDGARTLRLLSRHAAPADLDPASDDTRLLGVAVSALRLDGAVLALGDWRLQSGWHRPENGLRWTNGDATLRCGGADMLELSLAPCLLRYAVAGPLTASRAA